MFRRVDSQLALIGMSKKELAEKIGIRYNTLLLKLNGSSPLYLSEGIAIKKAIGWEGTFDALFEDVDADPKNEVHNANEKTA